MNKIIDNGELRNINKPARYVGGEVNQIIKNNARSNVILCYPNVYEKAMSNYIIKLLYNNINELKNVWCKRCFAPEVDFERMLRDIQYDIYSLEDKKSIKKSDILLFVIDNELDYTNLLNILNLSNIEYNKLKRKNEDPKILIFVTNNINIEPIKEIADFIINDDDEQKGIKKVISFIQEYSKTDEYIIDDANYSNIEIKENVSCIIPSIKIENLSIIIDLATVKNIDDTIIIVKKSIEEQGITKVSFVNQDKIDVNKFCELVFRLRFNIDDIRILVKNLDFSKFNPDTLNILLPCMEKSGIDFNVVTCRSRLKNILNIGMDKDDLIDNVKSTFKNGWSSIRLIFNIGLPNETYEDIDDIFNIAEEIVNIYSKSKAKEKLSLIINFNCYIPNLNQKNKYNVNNINKLETKIRYINEKRYDPVIKINVDTIDNYITRILLKNGGKDVLPVIVCAYELGARFDDNSKSYNKNAWDKAIYNNSNITDKYTKFNV